MNISGELEKLKEQIENELEKCFANFENVNNLKHEMILKSFIEKSVVKYKNHMDKNVRT